MAAIPDYPIIRNCERSGWSDGKDPEYPVCPVCGTECETLYADRDGDVFACDVCVKTKDAWEAAECFPGKENS